MSKKKKFEEIEQGKIVLTNRFKVGDIVCSWQNYKRGLTLFFSASDYDVRNYSGKGGLYYKLVFE